MAYRVHVTPGAARSIRKLTGDVQAAVMPVIGGLSDDPRPTGCKKLKGMHGSFRVRIGEYRALYLVDDALCEVLVLDVRHRREAYR